MSIEEQVSELTHSIKTDDEIRAYLRLFLEEGGLQGLAVAIGNIARQDIPDSHLAELLRKYVAKD